MFAVLQTFSEEKIVVERERASKCYRLSSFYIGKVAAELPLNLVSPLVFGCAVYWMVGLNSKPERFFLFLLILLEVGFAAVGLGIYINSHVSFLFFTAFGFRHDYLSILFYHTQSPFHISYLIY